MKNNSDQTFWRTTPLEKFTQEQWESICDGCAQCCAHKLINDETEELFLTNVVCQYLDQNRCRCNVYDNRNEYVPDCIQVTPENAHQLTWMPETCGYKLLAQRKPLPDWHPLVTGDPSSTSKAQMSVKDKVISEADINVEDLEDYVVESDYFSRLCRDIGAKI